MKGLLSSSELEGIELFRQRNALRLHLSAARQNAMLYASLDHDPAAMCADVERQIKRIEAHPKFRDDFEPYGA